MRHNILDIEVKPQFVENGKLLLVSQKRYNDLLERLHEDYSELLQETEELTYQKENIARYGDDVASSAQSGDIDDIRRSIENIDNELYDLECALSNVDELEKSIDFSVKEMMKIEKRLKFKPTQRNLIVRAAESLMEN
jgi:hypothetical protein